nr:hypothetical protein [Tanacetum cinerariifolium]
MIQREFTRRLNGLIGEMNEACADRMAFVQELQSVVGESVPAKTVVFLEQMVNKEGSRECQLADLVTEANYKVYGDKGVIVKAYGFFVGMCIVEGDYGQKGVSCGLFKRGVDSANWDPQLIYYYEKSKLDDIRLARQINIWCDTLTGVIDERWLLLRN